MTTNVGASHYFDILRNIFDAPRHPRYSTFMDESLIARRLGALGNDTRLQIYRLLVRAGPEGMPVGDLQRHRGSHLDDIASPAQADRRRPRARSARHDALLSCQLRRHGRDGRLPDESLLSIESLRGGRVSAFLPFLYSEAKIASETSAVALTLARSRSALAKIDLVIVAALPASSPSRSQRLRAEQPPLHFRRWPACGVFPASVDAITAIQGMAPRLIAAAFLPGTRSRMILFAALMGRRRPSAPAVIPAIAKSAGDVACRWRRSYLLAGLAADGPVDVLSSPPARRFDFAIYKAFRRDRHRPARRVGTYAMARSGYLPSRSGRHRQRRCCGGAPIRSGKDVAWAFGRSGAGARCFRKTR
jgi:hypothetical protein